VGVDEQNSPTLSLHRSLLCLCLPETTFKCLVKEEMYLKVVLLLLCRGGKPAQGQSLLDTHCQHPRKVSTESVDIRREVGGEVEATNVLVVVWAASGWGQVP